MSTNETRERRERHGRERRQEGERGRKQTYAKCSRLSAYMSKHMGVWVGLGVWLRGGTELAWRLVEC